MFPAQAGVILTAPDAIVMEPYVPRAGGGDPALRNRKAEFLKCSPRRRG